MEANYDAVLNSAKTGGFSTHGTIVLSHEINGNTMEIAEGERECRPSSLSQDCLADEHRRPVDDMMENFDHIVPVAVCQNWTHPYIEQSYTFPTFAQWVGGDINVTNSSSPTTSTSTSILLTSTVSTGGSSAKPTTTGAARTLSNSRAFTTSSSTQGVFAQAHGATSSSPRGAGSLSLLAALASIPALSALVY